MKKNTLKIAYGLSAIVGLVAIGAGLVSAFDIPLNSAPVSLGSGFRGQVKAGNLTIGTATAGQGKLNVVGATGLKIQKTNCTIAPYTGANAWPCPTTVALGPELRVLQLGYTYKMVVGAPAGTVPTTGTMLDVIGAIKGDALSMNYNGGTYYQGSTVNKPLCALPDGQIAVCGTTGACGADNGAFLNSAPTQLCSNGTASFVMPNSLNTQWTWTCTVGVNNAPDQCVAYRALSSSGGNSSGGPGGTPINTAPGTNGGFVPASNSNSGTAPVAPTNTNQQGG